MTTTQEILDAVPAAAEKVRKELEPASSGNSGLLYFRNHDTGRAYKTGGQYGNSVYVLLDFGWILSTERRREDLNCTDMFSPISEAEI